MPAIQQNTDADPSDIIEDQHLRSQYMRRLITMTVQSANPTPISNIPRILFQFWDSTNIPDDVQTCMNSWSALDDLGFERLVFNSSQAGHFISSHFSSRHVAAFKRCGHPAMQADYFRLCYMQEVGGFYVDADDAYVGGYSDTWFLDDRLKLQPLCYDIATDSMLNYADMLIRPQSRDTIYYVNNNPLIAPSHHPIIEMALERATVQLLNHIGDGRDIQAMTGPGNLTACVVTHALELEEIDNELDFVLLADWDTVALSKWPLDYRSDGRNWRQWVRGPLTQGQQK